MYVYSLAQFNVHTYMHMLVSGHCAACPPKYKLCFLMVKIVSNVHHRSIHGMSLNIHYANIANSY